MATELARKTAELANHDVGERESLGKNDSPRIRVMGRTCNVKPPAPYCACAVCTWIQEAAQELGWPVRFRKSARAMGLAENNPTLRHDPHVLEPDMIPCVGVIDHGGGTGHAFLIIGMSDNGDLQTIEANSNGAGARDGQGIYALNIRHVKDLKWIVEIA